MDDKQKVVARLEGKPMCTKCKEPLQFRGMVYRYAQYYCLKCKRGWEWCNDERQTKSSS